MTQPRSGLDAVTRRIKAEFVEMPGLSVTPEQAAKLWGLDKATCEVVIDALVHDSFLRRTPAGSVTRAA